MGLIMTCTFLTAFPLLLWGTSNTGDISSGTTRKLFDKTALKDTAFWFYTWSNFFVCVPGLRENYALILADIYRVPHALLLHPKLRATIAGHISSSRPVLGCNRSRIVYHRADDIRNLGSSYRSHDSLGYVRVGFSHSLSLLDWNQDHGLILCLLRFIRCVCSK